MILEWYSRDSFNSVVFIELCSAYLEVERSDWVF